MKKFIKILKEHKGLFIAYVCVLFLIYLTYLWINLDIEKSRLKIMMNKNYLQKVEIKTL
jgi:hypothetical protein